MKLNPDYILRDIAGEKIIVPTGNASQKINGMINLNSTAAFLWECVDKGLNRQEMIAQILQTFEVDEETAIRDVNGFSDMLLREGFASEDGI